MSFGLELTNSNNQLMFSSDFAAFHFISKLNATNVGDPFKPFNYQINFSCNGRPLVFTEGLDSSGVVAGSCILKLTDLGSNNWSATLIFRGTGPSPATIPVYIFGFASTPANTGYGGFVKSATGVTMLNLQQRVLKISGAHQTIFKQSSIASIPPPDPLFSGTIPENYILSCPPIGESLRSSGPTVFGTYFGLVPYRVASTTVGYRLGDDYGFSPAGVEAYTVYQNQYVLFADKTLYQ